MFIVWRVGHNFFDWCVVSHCTSLFFWNELALYSFINCKCPPSFQIFGSDLSTHCAFSHSFFKIFFNIKRPSCLTEPNCVFLVTIILNVLQTTTNCSIFLNATAVVAHNAQRRFFCVCCVCIFLVSLWALYFYLKYDILANVVVWVIMNSKSLFQSLRLWLAGGIFYLQ